VIREDEGEQWAELYPDRLAFAEPWDGTYDT
jgi:formate hydrogenlyase regulatory protein HycA